MSTNSKAIIMQCNNNINQCSSNNNSSTLISKSLS